MIAVGVGSYFLRAFPLFVGESWLASPKIERVISHAGSAALAALIATGLHRSAASPTDTVATVLTAAVALTVAVRGGSMQRVLIAGALVYAAARTAIFIL
jgi:branched-subunit amino acid transport protein